LAFTLCNRMKRVVWLLLAVFCSALAQVQPAERPNVVLKDCSCCQHPEPCSMPGCCPPPAAGSRTIVSLARAAASVPAARRAPRLASRAEAKFYARFVRAVLAPNAFPASVFATTPASVPLFKAHCSFLI